MILAMLLIVTGAFSLGRNSAPEHAKDSDTEHARDNATEHASNSATLHSASPSCAELICLRHIRCCTAAAVRGQSTAHVKPPSAGRDVRTVHLMHADSVDRLR